MKSDALKIAKKFVVSIKTNGIPVTTAYLFGSYAKGNPHPGSDIDVCIVSSKLGKDFIDEYVKLSTVAGKIDDRIEPHPMSPADFAEKYNLLAHEVKTQGIPIIL
ncbi:MAG: polymerase, beta-like protein region protein [Candidatus Amesbacteria bacterium GW2011_GWC2_47_8]|uniref:Polymerase, beta-like protein region protein n=1 Tax=Candidatus Amesbacteria bacterium GW2011_GWC2_47_8 TaxID=1618367 RepID=A0A0G1TLH5_9BACT|nr:MAG: polymerase, beta-like protein region protein [Candidatus Amesbacteria bacterium GW2011_GWC2_47_8]